MAETVTLSIGGIVAGEADQFRVAVETADLQTHIEQTDLLKRYKAACEAQLIIDSGEELGKEFVEKLRQIASLKESILDQMLKSNARLVFAAVSKLTKQNTPTATYQDLVQEGLIGLQRAVEKFDTEKGYRFSTYASWWIKQALQRHVDDLKSSNLRIPVGSMYMLKTFWAYQYSMEAKGQEGSLDDYCRETGADKDRIEELTRLYRRSSNIASLSQPLGDGERGGELADLIVDEGYDDPYEEVLDKATYEMLREEFMLVLDDRELYILERRFGISSGGAPATLAEIARELSLTRERIRQLESSALKKLNKHLLREGYSREELLAG